MDFYLDLNHKNTTDAIVLLFLFVRSLFTFMPSDVVTQYDLVNAGKYTSNIDKTGMCCGIIIITPSDNKRKKTCKMSVLLCKIDVPIIDMGRFNEP